MKLQERVEVYKQLLTIISKPYYTYGFCAGLLLAKYKSNDFNVSISISDYPELMKYKPEGVISRGEYWFPEVGQTERIRILKEILNKVDK